MCVFWRRPSLGFRYIYICTQRKEDSHALEITVHSSIPGLPHLLEHGHANRGGGRTSGQAHIAPAEQSGIEQLETEIERCLTNG